MWTRLYPILYYVDFYEAKGLTREAVYQAFSDRIGANMEVKYF